MPDSYVNFHVYGRWPGHKKRQHLANAWSESDAEALADEYQRKGWKRVTIRADAQLGRCLRFKVFLTLTGRWEKAYLESDLKVIKEALEKKRARTF